MLVFTAFSQVDPELVLKDVIAKMDQYHDYSADVEIEVDVDFINIPVKHATMYFKQPDKITYKSKDFLMLPKKGLGFSIKNLLKDEYTAIFSGYDTINGHNHYMIKVIPLARKPKIILSNLWIGQERLLVTRMENFTRNEGSYILNFEYPDPTLDLPGKMIIQFEVEQFKVPMKFMGKDIEIDKEKLNEEGKHKGVVIIRFSNYKVNVGVKDEVFDP